MHPIVEIGSHTCRHRNMRHLSGPELEIEISGSKQTIEAKINRQIIAFSYPNRYYNPEIVEHVRKAGYRFAVTTDKGINDTRDPLKMKRINLWERSSSVIPGQFLEGKLGLKLAGI
jgi:peptidoglycan/xylan/chitin deacetylase (PgdA/CDA1 family)